MMIFYGTWKGDAPEALEHSISSVPDSGRGPFEMGQGTTTKTLYRNNV